MITESARTASAETARPARRKGLPRRALKIILPLVMLGVGAYTVWSAGLQGLVALLPILAAHVVGFPVIYPLWVRYRRRRGATGRPIED